jgi:1-acyl-sn-glycerol-3-phosphate acyltransferase
MSNHESALDILLGFVAIPNKTVFLAKKELFKIPIFGWAMKAAGMIKIDRQNPDIARKSVDNAVDILVNSSFSTLIYPEGTRSQNGELLPFKKGGFILAIRSQLPIVPVTILGAGKALPKGKFNIKRTRIIVVIDKPITTYGMNINDKEELLQKCRTVIIQNLNNLNHNRNAKYKLYSA